MLVVGAGAMLTTVFATWALQPVVTRTVVTSLTPTTRDEAPAAVTVSHATVVIMFTRLDESTFPPRHFAVQRFDYDDSCHIVY